MHRKVPLSEGRIEGGGLQCGYHGWIFGSDGRPTHIPQVKILVLSTQHKYFSTAACFGEMLCVGSKTARSSLIP